MLCRPSRLELQKIVNRICKSWQAEILANGSVEEFSELEPVLNRLVERILFAICAEARDGTNLEAAGDFEKPHQSLRSLGEEVGSQWCELGTSLEQCIRRLQWLRNAVLAYMVPADGRIPFTLQDAEEIQSVFDQVTLATVNGYMRGRQRQFSAALEAERRPLDHLKSELIGVVSHELRTPLTAVLGYSDVLLRGLGGDLNESQRHHLQQIRNAGQQLLTLITNLLEYSTIEAGLGQFTLAPVDMAALLNRLVKEIEPLAREKKITVETEIAADLPRVLVDYNRTQQAVYQILTNALKFNASGGHVFIKTHFDSKESRVILSVHDTGIGIPSEQLALIWEIFQQADTSSTRRYGGLGLGLAVARKMIEAQNGRIWAESGGPGHGATFAISLPVAGVPPADVIHSDEHSDGPPPV